MAGDDDFALAQVFRRLPASATERLDFEAADTESTLAKVHHLTAVAIYFNMVAVAEFGGRAGPARDLGLVEQVIAAAFQTYGGADPHPTPFDKAAMLPHGITQGHPFDDGNKRTGFLLTAYYLDLVGYAFPPRFNFDEDEALSVRVSAGELRNLDIIAAELVHLWSGETSGR